MASNLDYLDPALLPLEEKVKAYLEAEKALHRATEALHNEPLRERERAQSGAQFEQRPPAGSFNQEEDELIQTAANLRANLAHLEQEIIALLPTRDEWVKVNLGYGPSRVGAWHVPALNGAPERYELRVVH
ncbi:hypothetical protein IC235_08995 [Hymenobacter sp. BT664]|uniref:Uncharacterized protein n=1 Tax=Hymenobacter montanus TaxID=2771359 RepID=A0A927GJC9_9BACT|nr:hypothetical protein [Hymenobacter montanus]MBD2768024.1 hypothetical protein [Hymenobacter montanus]